MESRDVRMVAAETSGQQHLVRHTNVQVESSRTEPDDLGAKRANLVKKMCFISMVTLAVSVLSIFLGVIAGMTSDLEIPYVISGAAISGGMAFLLTICPFCMYCEEKKTKRGINIASTFTCCLSTMIVWFCVSFCIMVAAVSLSGIWGIIQCDKVVRKTGYSPSNPCTEHTDEKLGLSIVTLIITGLLMALSVSVMCVYLCNTKTFRFKTSNQRQYGQIPYGQRQYRFYPERSREGREDTFCAFLSDQNAQRNIQDRDSGPSNQPSAPPFECTDTNLHDDNEYRNWTEPEKELSPRRPVPPNGQERWQRAERYLNTNDDIEEPPPGYDDVIETCLNYK